VLPLIEFPVGHMMKNDVKYLANEMNLERIAKKNESMLRKRVHCFLFDLVKVWVYVLLENENFLDLFLNIFQIISVL
jgi:hypothetical protein